jgi:TRAP-type C4-dicarboxylate transport system substrate-binding protein
MNRVSRIVTIMSVILIYSMTTPASSQTQTKPIDLKIAMWVGATHPGGICAKQWSDELEKRTQGRIKAIYYYSEALGKAPTYPDLVQSGGTDAATVMFGYSPGRFPLLEIMNLPFVWPDGDVSNKVYYDLYAKGYFAKELAKYKLLYLATTAPYDIIARNPIRNPSEAKGKRLRSGGGPWSPTIEAWGAVPVTIPAGEAYPALERGILDGVVQGIGPAFNLKLHEIAKFVNLNDIGSFGFCLAMNLDYYKKLPADIQKVIDDLATEQRNKPQQGRIFTEEASKAVDQLPGLGVTVYRSSSAEIGQWKDLAKPVIEKWINDMEKKGLPGKQMIEDLVTAAKKYGVSP